MKDKQRQGRDATTTLQEEHNPKESPQGEENHPIPMDPQRGREDQNKNGGGKQGHHNEPQAWHKDHPAQQHKPELDNTPQDNTTPKAQACPTRPPPLQMIENVFCMSVEKYKLNILLKKVEVCTKAYFVFN